MQLNNITNTDMMPSTKDGLFTAIADMLNISNNTSGFLIYLLVMIGVLIIIAVLVYNWWEERRFNMEVESSFSPIENDVLLDKNKQEFLDKFAATTGYLNDEPADQSLSPAEIESVDETKSIEDVYKELLETMEKRPTKIEYIDNDGKVTINHDTIEPHNIKSERTDTNPEPILYIPEEVSIEPESIDVSKALNEAQAPLTEQMNERGEPETQQSIKDIISRAFNTNGQTINATQNKTIVAEAAAPIDVEVEPDELTIPQPVVDEIPAAVEDLSMADDEVQTETNHIHEVHEAKMSASANQAMSSSMLDTTAFKEEPQSMGATPAQELADEPQTSDDGLLKFNGAQPETTEKPENNLANNAFNKRKTDQPNSEYAKDDAFTATFTSTLPSSLNAHMDLIGKIVIPKGVTPSFLLESFSSFYKDFDKPVFAYSQTDTDNQILLNDATLLVLTDAVNATQEVHITASIQLADRTGPASKNTINRFQTALESIATGLALKVNWLDNEDPVYKASALDAFCIEVDKTMFFHLTDNGKGPFTGTKLKGLVEGQGMELADNGQYQYFDIETKDQLPVRMPEFVMFNRDNHPFNPEMLRTSVIKAVTFQLDIPHINASGTALDRMVIIAKSLEESLNVLLVDDQNRPLGALHIDKIREQVKSIHATMQLRGITPGSAFAHRLFS